MSTSKTASRTANWTETEIKNMLQAYIQNVILNNNEIFKIKKYAIIFHVL